MGVIFECTTVISFKENAKQGSLSRILLKKYDHVSDYYKQLHWLPLDQFIKFRSMCSMYKQFHLGRCIPLDIIIAVLIIIIRLLFMTSSGGPDKVVTHSFTPVLLLSAALCTGCVVSLFVIISRYHQLVGQLLSPQVD